MRKNRMRIDRTATSLAVAALLAVMVAFAGDAHAVSRYLTDFNSTYGTTGTALDTCNVCHTSVPSRNSYGADFAANGHSFTAIADLDSDGDGATNGAEITARTFPGDQNSKPVASDTTAPQVGSTSPVNGATSVATGSSVAVTFSEAVSPASVTPTTFTLKNGATSVPGAVSVSGSTSTFQPSAALLNGTAYTATVTTGVKDLAGNGMAADYSWTFTTAAAADTTPPAVSSVTPADGSTNITVNTIVTATFNEPVSSASVIPTTFTLKNGATSVPGTLSVSGSTATFRPTAALVGGVTYTAAVTTGVTDLAGNALQAGHSWSFTTGSAADTTPPTVSSNSPADGASGVAATSAATATFSEPLDPATVTTATITLKDAANIPVAGAVTYAGSTATFAPAAPLAAARLYTATLTTGLKDAAGNALAQPHSWSFTTAAQAADRDDDGVDDDEDDYPDDHKKATPHQAKGKGKIKIDTSRHHPTAYLKMVRAIADSDPSINQSGKPAGYEFRDGLLDYEVHGIASGETVQVELTYPEPLPAGSKVYEVNSSGFHELPGSVISGNVVTLTLTDGGRGDRDATANSVIDDPVGVASPAASDTPSSAGGGCSMVTPGGDPRDVVGAYGFLALTALALGIRSYRGRKNR